MLLIFDAISILIAGMFGPLYGIFVERIGGDILQASSIWTAFLFTAGVLTFVLSRWVDSHRHYRKLLLANYAMQTIGYIGYLFVQNPLTLLIVQVVFGVARALGSPAYDALYSINTDRKHPAYSWGLWESMQPITTAAGALIGGLVASIYGFSTLFMLMSIVSLMSLAYIVINAPKIPESTIRASMSKAF